MNLNYNLFFRRLSSASYLRHVNVHSDEHHHLISLTSADVGKDLLITVPSSKELDYESDVIVSDASSLNSDVKFISTAVHRNLSKNKHTSNEEYRIKVITDIDDTVKSSGGIRLLGFITLGGIDNQYKRGQFYPGVMQFGLELSKTGKSRNKEEAVIPSKITVLTARAKELKFAMALKPSSKVCSAYRKLGDVNGVHDWGIGDVYYGSVAEWIISWRKGIRKFSNFELMLRNDISQGYENNKYIIIGDTGEKDEDAAERIINKYPSNIKAVFLHNVYDMKNQYQPNSNPVDRTASGVPIFYFRTYIGAAVKAYHASIINKEALKRITIQAIDELRSSHQSTISKLNEMKVVPKFIIDRNQRAYNSRWSELVDDANQCSFLIPLVPKDLFKVGNTNIQVK